MKRFRVGLLMTFVLAALILSSGCVPGKVKRQAESNKKQYEEAFRQKVKKDYGKDYALTEVEGYVYWEHWDLQIPGYVADSSLTGKLTHAGETYDARYYFMDDKMTTDANNQEIIEDLAYVIGLDPTKVVYGAIVNGYEDQIMFDSGTHTVDRVLKDHGTASSWDFYIATTENYTRDKFFDYTVFMDRIAMNTDFRVHIFIADDFDNFDHLKEHWTEAGLWSDENVQPQVLFNGEYKDVGDVYNLKRLTMINYSRKGMTLFNYLK